MGVELWHLITGGIAALGAAIGIIRSRRSPSVIPKGTGWYRSVLSLLLAKVDRDRFLTQLGIDPADPAARRLAIAEIDRLQSLDHSKGE